MFYQKKRCLIVDEGDVAAVLLVINRNQGFFSNNYKLVEHCGWSKDPMKWHVRFSASEREWGHMIRDLSSLGKVTVKVEPGGTTGLYLIKNES